MGQIITSALPPDLQIQKSNSKELKKYSQNYFYYAKMPLFRDYTIPKMQARKNLKHVITFSEQVQ